MGNGFIYPVFNNMDADFQSQVLTAPVFFSGVNEELRKFSVAFGNSCLHCRADHLVTVDQHVCLSQIKQQARKEFLSNGSINQHRFACVAYTGTLSLCVQDYLSRHGKISRFVYINMAVADTRFDYRHYRVFHAMLNKASATTRNKHIDQAAKTQQGVGLRAVG